LGASRERTATAAFKHIDHGDHGSGLGALVIRFEPMAPRVPLRMMAMDGKALRWTIRIRPPMGAATAVPASRGAGDSKVATMITA
jgi:hypothetical protein